MDANKTKPGPSSRKKWFFEARRPIASLKILERHFPKRVVNLAVPDGVGMKRLDLQPLDYTVIIGFLAYSASAVSTPICLVLLARELGLNLGQGGAIEAVRSLALLGVLLLSGFAAARWGKARTLGVGTLGLGAALLLYAAAPSYAAVLLAMAMAGIGSGMLEGLLNPLVQDQHPGDSGRYLNLSNGFWSVGVMGTVLMAGELLTRGVSWRAILVAVGLFSLVGGVLFLVFAKQEHTHRPDSLGATVGHLRGILREPLFWPFALAMFLGGGAEGAFTFWSASYVQLCFGGTPRAGGIGTACFAGGMVVGRFACGHWVGQRHLPRLIVASAAGGVLVSLLVPVVGSARLMYVVLVLAGLTVACFWPSIQSYAGDRIRHDHTMLFILLSCAGIPGFGLTCWLMGWIADVADLRVSFMVLPGLFLGLVATMVAIARPRGSR